MNTGIINVYKEAGYTSFDVVAKLRGILHIKKIGHTGTLDPDAVGVLPVCVGKATKVCDVLTDRDKTYEAEVVLGIRTDTLDTSGNIIETKPVSVTEDGLKAVLLKYIGDTVQIPPMYSAVKVDGKKLYEYAREGKEVKRKERHVTIYELDLVSVDLPVFKIRVKCSKGTYIRTLCDDIGRDLGCGAAMKHLIRTSVGRFDVGDSLTLDEIEKMVSSGESDGLFLPIDEVFDSYEKKTIKNEFAKLLSNGNPLKKNMLVPETKSSEVEIIRVYDEAGRFVALYKWIKDKNHYKVEKYFGPEGDD